MKVKTISKQICLACALIMLISSTACRSSKGGDSSDNSTNSDLSSLISSSEESSVVSESTDVNSSQASNTSSQASNTSSQSSTGNQANVGPKTSLSLDDVLKNMPKELRGTTLNYLYIGDLKDTYLKDAVNGFESETGIKLKTEVVSKDSIYPVLASKIASGNSPDMAILYSNDVGYVSNFQPITASGYNFNDTAWDSELMKKFTFNGNTYAINLANTPFRNMTTLVYNKKALTAKAELEDPFTIWQRDPNSWTWEKLWSMCDEFLKANKNKEGFYGLTLDFPDSYLGAFGAGLFGYDENAGKYVSYLNNTDTTKAFENIIECIEKKYITKTPDSNAFIAGYIPFMLTYSSCLDNGNESYAVLKKSNNLAAVPLPIDSKYNPIFETVAYGIPVGAKNAKAVPYFVRYVMDGTCYDMSNFYMDKQSETVIKTELTRKTFYSGNASFYDVWTTLTNGTSAQVKSVLDSYSSMINSKVNEKNNDIAKLPK